MRLVIGLMVTLVIGVVFLNILATPFTNAATENATDVESVVTGAAETTQTVTLPRTHWYGDTTGLSVSCATDAGATVNSIDSTRLIVTLGSLSTSTTQNCTTTFVDEKQKSDGSGVKEFVGIVKIIPLLVSLAVLGAAFVGLAVGASAATGRSFGGIGRIAGQGMDIAALLVLLVGMFLVDTIENFIDTAQTTYDNLPEFSGVSSLLSIVLIGYLLSIASLAIGGVIGRFRGRGMA